MTRKFLKIGYIVMLPTQLRTYDQGQNQTTDEAAPDNDLPAGGFFGDIDDPV
jgi:hypothetical protein